MAAPLSVTGKTPQFRSAAAMNAFQTANDALARTAVVDIPAGSTLEAEMAKWNGRSDIELVEPNYPMHVSVVPNDTLYSTQWALKNSGQAGSTDAYDPAVGTAGDDVDAEGAWSVQTGSNTVIIAIIDAGIDIDHEDLAANIVTGYDFGDNDAIPDDTCTNAIVAFNSRGHGTHVAGIAGAVGNNGKGIAGINWSSKIMPLKVADNTCAIYTGAVVDAIDYARTHGADVINMSLGGEGSSTLQAAVVAADAANIVIVAAAGNEGTEDPTNSYPAAYSTTTNVIAVAATDRTDELASFSNRGSWITLSAPGVGIRSTYPNDLYANLSGTSMASPLVAGAAALILSEQPSLTPAQVRSRLATAAENIDAQNALYVGKIGAGRLNVLNALFGVTSVSPSTAPNSGALSIATVTITGVNFSTGMTAKLTRSGQSDISGSGIGIVSANTATVTFNVNGALGGRWNVVLTKVGGATTTLEEGFAVTSSSFNVLTLSPSQSYTSTITVIQGVHTIVWPANVLPYGITLDVDGAPTAQAVGSGEPYAITGVQIELTPSSATATNLSGTFQLTLSYRPQDLLYPTNEGALTIARYNEENNRWYVFPSVVDQGANTVTASINHLSQFAILQATAAVDLNRARAFPNPLRAQRGDDSITFTFLTSGARVRIYDVAGNLVRDLKDEIGSGTIYWADLKNESGDDVASGIYFYLITDPSGHTEKGRLGIIR